MDREYISNAVPEKLAEWVRTSGRASRFRRRAVLANANGAWELLCCTVEGFLPSEDVPDSAASRHYRQAILFEDFLSGEESLAFARDLTDGTARICDLELQCAQNPQWSIERLPVDSDTMTRAGSKISIRLAQKGAGSAVKTLLAADQPYYPDVYEAARDWLPFPVYHGSSDGRNEQVVFLLPEARAFIHSTRLPEPGTLEISVAGTQVDELPLLIRGAFWVGNSIHQISAVVSGSGASVSVATDADRLEYYLIDQAGVVYDFRREDRRYGGARYGTILGSLDLQSKDQVQVLQACESGEGQFIEFKPLVDPSDKLWRSEASSKRRKNKTKLREVIETVAALANSKGGHIYLGVNDDCTVVGVDRPLREWAKSALSEGVVSRYIGALKSRIKEVIRGEVALGFAHTEIDGMLVVVVEVFPVVGDPVALSQEFHLYVRTGASNRIAPPEQWRSLLKIEDSGRVF